MEGIIPYPFQLRHDVWVTLKLPANLTREEVERLSAFLLLLATPESAPSVGAVDPQGDSNTGKPSTRVRPLREGEP